MARGAAKGGGARGAEGEPRGEALGRELARAARCGRADEVAKLLAEGGEAWKGWGSRARAVEEAVLASGPGRAACVAELLRGVDPEDPVSRRARLGWAMDAAKVGAAECIRELLDGVVAKGEPPRGEWTLLMEAARSGSVQCVQALLPLVGHEAVDENGRDALMVAAGGPFEKHSECVMALLPLCDPLARDAMGWDALKHAVSSGNSRSIMALLPRSDPLARGDRGMSALMVAVVRRDLASVKALVPHSDLRAAADDGATAAELAKRIGPKEVADELACELAKLDAAEIGAGLPLGKAAGRRSEAL